ncbi:MAG: hypothetical protein NC910_03180 [Candidatus Omnitrophica bacterium]|nr:hypothetical protein [Candidatus Omnitrophota bacterium]
MGKPKLGTILLSLALVGAIAAAAVIFLDRNKERDRRIWVEDQLEKIKIAKAALEKEIEELKSVKQTLETQLTDAASQAKKLADDLAAEKRSRETLSGELTKVRSEAASLNEKLRGLENEKKAVADELARAKQSYQALSNELTTLRQAKEALEKRVKEMLTAQSSQAERIVVRPAAPVGASPAAPASPAAAAPVASQPQPERIAVSAAPSSADMEGKVLVVNREFNFVVVNLGSNDGIEVGTRMNVFRSGKQIGAAQVERLYENMSAATILVEEQKTQLKEGDTVRVVS